MYVLATFCTLSAILVIFLLRWRKKTFEYFSCLGIPGPEPNIIWGNLKEYHQNDRHNALEQWCEKYGDIFGFYNGDVPTLVVKDLDFLNYVFVSNFKNFVDRGITMRTDQEHSFLGESMIHAKDPQWRFLRNFSSREFTSHKLKQMMPHLVEQGDIFMDIVRKLADDGGQKLMNDAFQALSMDFACRAAFGMDTDFQHNKKCPFYIKADGVIPGMMKGPFHAIAQCTTTFGIFLKPFFWLNKVMGTFTMKIFAEEMKKVVRLRTENPSTERHDMLQNLLEARVHTMRLSDEFGLKKFPDSKAGDLQNPRRPTEDEVVLLSTVLFLGSFQTSSVTLSFMSLLLAMHPEIQEKVRQEVKAAIANSGCLDYDTVTKELKYTRQVMYETLRLFPPSITFHTRSAKESFTYKGITFKAGTCISAPVIQLHRDPQHWPEPNKFDPDRFDPENKEGYCKAAFQPFGVGPRRCVGYKLAILQVLYFTARIVAEFKMELGEAQKGDIPIRTIGMMSKLDNGPWIKFTRI